MPNKLRLVSVVLVLIALFGQTSVFAAQDAVVVNKDLEAIANALEARGVVLKRYQQGLGVCYETDQFRDRDGENGLCMWIGISEQDSLRWIDIESYSIAHLGKCDYPSAAFKVLLQCPEKTVLGPSFTYDDSDGTVTVGTRVPLRKGGVDGELVHTVCKDLVYAVDEMYPVLRRAMRTGFVDWPQDDEGPKKPTFELGGKVDGDEQQATVGWAVWAEEKAWASTLVGAAGLLKVFHKANDEDRDELARYLSSEWGGQAAADSFADWVQGWHYLEQHSPPVAVRCWGVPGTKVTVTLGCPKYSHATAQASAVIDEMGYVDVEPLLDWDVESLMSITKPEKADFEVTVEALGARQTERAAVEFLPVRFIDNALPSVLSVALHVNEPHPWVQQLIKEAKQTRVAPQLGTPNDIERQVYAVWLAFRNRGIEYSNIAAADGKAGYSQTIRMLHEAVGEEGANCADGSAAFASVLQALGMDVHLIGVPGHVLIGVYMKDKETDRWLYLETTMLGERAVVPTEFLDHVERTLPEALRGAEWDVFEAACEVGKSTLDESEIRSTDLVSIKSLRNDDLVTPLPIGKADVGPLPPLPNQENMRAERKAAKARVDEWLRVRDARIAALGTPQVQGYKSLDALRKDFESFGRDPAAAARIFRAFDGESLEAKCIRGLALLVESLHPVFSSAVQKFGPAPLPFLKWISTDLKSDIKEREGWWLVTVEGERGELPCKVVQRDGMFVFDEATTSRFDPTGGYASVALDLKTGVVQQSREMKGIAKQLQLAVEQKQLADWDQFGERFTNLLFDEFPPLDLEKDMAPPPVPSPAGALVTDKDTIEFHYSIALSNGKVVFDSKNEQGGKPTQKAVAKLTPKVLIPEVVAMREGETRSVVVQPKDNDRWRKGDQKRGIPPNSVLTYTITVVRVVPPA